MTPALLALTGASAVVDWVAVHRGDKRLEYVSKPLTLLALIGAAVASWSHAGDAAPWLLAALTFSLAGDVFLMLPGNLFVPGLASFLVAHICYVVAFEPDLPDDVGAWLVVAFVLGVGAALFVRLLRGLRDKALTELLVPVAAYSIAISLMLYSAVTHSFVAAVGAAFFYVSDSLIGWTRFVGTVPHGSVLIHVTYHVAQVLLVVALIA